VDLSGHHIAYFNNDIYLNIIIQVLTYTLCFYLNFVTF